MEAVPEFAIVCVLATIFAVGIVGTFAWGMVFWLYDSLIRVALIPQSQIDLEADEITRDYGAPEYEAYQRYYAEWHRSSGFRIGRARRVRRAVKRRLKAGKAL